MTGRDFIAQWVEATCEITSTDRTIVRVLRAALAAGRITYESLRADDGSHRRDRAKCLAAIEGLYRADPRWVEQALHEYFVSLIAATDWANAKGAGARRPQRHPESSNP